MPAKMPDTGNIIAIPAALRDAVERYQLLRMGYDALFECRDQLLRERDAAHTERDGIIKDLAKWRERANDLERALAKQREPDPVDAKARELHAAVRSAGDSGWDFDQIGHEAREAWRSIARKVLEADNG